MTKIDQNKIFSDITFVMGAHNSSQIPQHHYPEIALIGASNVGKSSLINAIFNKKIAIVSSTPGRTRQLNFFKVAGFKDGFFVVDLPGYGYAEAAFKHQQHWQKTTFEYLLNRANLKRVFLLIDAVKGLKDHDLEVIEFFNNHGILFQVIVTKIDKILLSKQTELSDDLIKRLENYSAFYNKILLVSSDKKFGIKSIQNEIINLLKNQ